MLRVTGSPLSAPGRPWHELLYPALCHTVMDWHHWNCEIITSAKTVHPGEAGNPCPIFVSCCVGYSSRVSCDPQPSILKMWPEIQILRPQCLSSQEVCARTHGSVALSHWTCENCYPAWGIKNCTAGEPHTRRKGKKWQWASTHPYDWQFTEVLNLGIPPSTFPGSYYIVLPCLETAT